MTAANPATETEVSAELIEQMQPPCEAIYFTVNLWGLSWNRWGFGRPVEGSEQRPCPDPAEWVMTVALQCSCIHQDGLTHVLGCPRHALMEGTPMRCQCCGALGRVVGLEPI